MNRAFAIILIPALLVAAGYVFVFRYMGVSPAYWRLFVPVILLGCVLWWLGRKSTRKMDSGAH
jgi:hypothetical protein